MPKKHIVRRGDCIASIAFRYGFFWDTLWHHPANKPLANRRKDPNVLLAGDEVEIPDRTPKSQDGATDTKHRFKVKGVPAKLRLKVMRGPDPEGQEREPDGLSSAGRSVTSEDPEPAPARSDEPRGEVDYALDIDGKLIRGTTADDGLIEISIPPDARRGVLIVEPGTPNETVTQLELGALDPISEVSGVSQRLANLGMGCEPGNEMTPELGAALTAFQHKHGLEVTGEIDSATRNKLEELHDS
jgi:N-acetylmuramoyl-L-alanine amidase